MNDSFLEDLELIPKETRKTNYNQPVDCHVTTRHATSSPLLHFSEQDKKDNIIQSQKEYTTTVPNIPDIRIANNKEYSSKDFKKQLDQNIKKQAVKVKTSEKNEKIKETKVKSDVKIKLDNKQPGVSGISKIKSQETRLKVSESKSLDLDRNRRSGSYKKSDNSLSTSTKENKRSSDSSNYSSDISNKENSRPSDSSRENPYHDLTKEKEKLPDGSSLKKKSSFDLQDKDPILLTAIKELISTHTKQESEKILRCMQELYIKSQATLIKNLLVQTDDLTKEMHPSNDSTRMRTLIEDNKRLEQKLIILQVQNEDLQNKLQELESLKQENAALKLRYKISQT